ncbi:prolipoprotein diacylglyceryl transferase [bacterium]|nr:MAG: prolipoprotein diacylglyceryl transferase [bacterium]
MGHTAPMTPDPWAFSAFLGAGAAFWTALREAPRAGADVEDVWGVWPWAIVLGILGAWLYFQLAVGGDPRGTSIQGGMLGGLTAFLLYGRRRGVPISRLLDAFAPGAALAHAITRVGCFAAGCCYGRATGLPWAVVYSHGPAPRGVPLHPAQLYESALDLSLAFLLHRRLAAGPRRGGDVFWLYLGGVSAIRFGVQFLRDDDADRLVWGLAHSQFLALALVVVALLCARRGPLTKASS